jgi:phosphatidate cytidylyltransferase
MASEGPEAERHDVTADQAIVSPNRAGNPELVRRLLSGAAIAGFAFALLWAGVLPFAGLVLAVALVASWEWSRIVRGTAQPDLVLGVHGLAAGTAVLLAAFGYAALAVAIVVTGAVIVLVLMLGERALTSAAGVLYTGLPAIGLLWVRGDEPSGFAAAFFVIAVVAATDTGAFAAGRLFGGPKLAPSISPNKTWSGFGGGVTAGILTSLLCAYFLSVAPYGLAAIGLILSVVSQVGDLAESALKRAFGVKDASNLIPGHGGVLDRVDGVVAAALAAAVYGLLVDPHAPAHALLAGF